MCREGAWLRASRSDLTGAVSSCAVGAQRCSAVGSHRCCLLPPADPKAARGYQERSMNIMNGLRSMNSNGIKAHVP
jgi:hypothetical protein